MDLNVIRSFLIIAESGSMGRAARELHVSQSTLTRQIQALENEIGGVLFERSERGVVLTPAGNVFRKGIRPHVENIARVVELTSRTARGQHSTLRVGYIASAAPKYLNPALRLLRKDSPHVTVRLFDLTPTEQVAALREGELDLGLLGFSPSSGARDFYTRKLATVPAVAVLPDTHPLAKRRKVSLSELRDQTLIAIPEKDAPGYNNWVRLICRKSGFRPRFTDAADSMAHLIAMIAADNFAAILPAYAIEAPSPGLHIIPLSESYAVMDLVVVWQRGKASEAVRQMLTALFAKPPTR